MKNAIHSAEAFVIMPFGVTNHRCSEGGEIVTSIERWDYIFEFWLKRAVELFPDCSIKCRRSGATPGNFIKGIVQDLVRSEIVIADLTGARPNVYYELGIRNSLRPGTIIISQDLSALPSDLRSYYCFEYTYTSDDCGYKVAFELFTQRLHQHIRFVMNNPVASDSPVGDFLGFQKYQLNLELERSRKTFERNLTFLFISIVSAKNKISELLVENKPPRVWLNQIVEDVRDLVASVLINLSIYVDPVGLSPDLFGQVISCVRRFKIAFDTMYSLGSDASSKIVNAEVQSRYTVILANISEVLFAELDSIFKELRDAPQ